MSKINVKSGITHYYLTNGSKIGFFAQPFGGHIGFGQNGHQSGAFAWVHPGYVSMH